MKISVLMAVYNAEKWLPQALQSILVDQTHQDVELIAIDDCSTDRSPEILAEWQAQDVRLKVLRTPVNSGQAAARNLGIAGITGQVVCMVDSDDWLDSRALELVVLPLEKNPDVDCALFRLVSDYGNGIQEDYDMPYHDGDVINGAEAFRQSLTWAIHGLYAVRSDIQRKFPYDESTRLYSDDNTTRIHYLHSRKVAFTGGTYYYRRHAESMTTRISLDRFLYMEANLSMKRQLEREHVSPDILRLYEEHRWLNYIGQWALYYYNKECFNATERKEILNRLRTCYATFSGQPHRLKLGYIRLRPYALFVLQEKLYFTLRSIRERYRRSYCRATCTKS